MIKNLLLVVLMISFDHDFWDGFTDKTKTYNNLPLSIHKNFNTVKLELWSFQL